MSMINRVINSQLKTGKIMGALAFVGVLNVPFSVAGDDQQAGVYIAPSIGYLTHSSNRQFAKNEMSSSIALGYQWASPWAMELAYTRSNPDSTVFPGSIDSDQLRLDALYHFGGSENLQPYFLLGAGESKRENNLTSIDETLINAGFGIKYAFNDTVSLRSDVRSLFHLDTDASEAAFNFGLHILLGKGSSKAVTPVSTTPTDSDGDGVIDSRDHCSSTAKGTQVDANGCSLPSDKDGDGVVDSKDKCPDSELGAKVNSEGCYEVLATDVSVSLNVQFANNSNEVVSENLGQVESLANFMRQYPETKVEIEGHTDDRGAAEYNKQLSQKRAEAVAQILIQNYSVDASRVKAIGYGEENPLVTNATADGRAQNRRVQAVVKATVEKIVK